MASQKRKRRILFIGPFPPPIGGDTVATFNLFGSRYWAGSNISVSRINTSAGDRVRLYEEKLSIGDVLRGTRIILHTLIELPRADAVLLLANSRFVLTAGLAIILFCRAFKKPVIVRLFGTSLVQRIEECATARRKFVLSHLDKVAAVLAQTNAFADWLIQDAGLSAKRVIRFPNYLPDGAFSKRRVRESFGGSCIFVGQVKREKGVFDIIEALRGREDLRCDFFGQIVDRDRERFLDAVSKQGNVRYEGIIEPGSVIDVMGSYDVLLLPTYHGGEGYPMVILEAFASGIPVVTTEWRSLPELVEDGVRGILVPIKSPDRICEALDRLAADQRLHKAIADNASDYVRSLSEKELIGDTLITMIEKIWAEGAPRG